jgi:hypothetical protein
VVDTIWVHPLPLRVSPGTCGEHDAGDFEELCFPESFGVTFFFAVTGVRGLKSGFGGDKVTGASGAGLLLAVGACLSCSLSYTCICSLTWEQVLQGPSAHIRPLFSPGVHRHRATNFVLVPVRTYDCY